ncbi:MAG: phosphoadenylyl-sulfate reductase [Pseudomonadota bacterium]
MSACENEVKLRLCGESHPTAGSIERLNDTFAGMRAEDRVSHALECLPGQQVVTSSFGAQSALMLHMLTRQRPDVPVVLIDTGYLFAETYRFVDALTERLDLNLRVFRAAVSPAWQEARYGERWTRDRDALEDYNREVKVEPMREALKTLDVGTWFAGLRRSQADTRRDTPYVSVVDGRFKVHPVADWSDRDVHRYLRQHDLPYHPLWEHGYLSIGDHHSTRSIHEVSDAAELRFSGIKRECGLHEMDQLPPEPQP